MKVFCSLWLRQTSDKFLMMNLCLCCRSVDILSPSVTMFRPLFECFLLCIVFGSSKPTERKTRVHEEEPLSNLEHDDKKNYDYDHEAFLGHDEAQAFEQLPPEESKRRLR